MSAHEHDFHAMFWHYGPYGDQTVHLHPCGGNCEWELVGEGWDCDPEAPHYRHHLTIDGPCIPKAMRETRADREVLLKFRLSKCPQ